MGCEAVDMGEEGAEGCQETLGGETCEVHTMSLLMPHTPAEIGQMAAHQTTTCLQPHEPLLVGQIVAGTTTSRHQDHQQGRKTVTVPNDDYIIWAPR
jgi:hypothetical protein